MGLWAKAQAMLYSLGTLVGSRVCLVQACGRPVSLEEASDPTRAPWLESFLWLVGILIHKYYISRLFVVAAVVSAQTPIQGWHTHPLDVGTTSQLHPSLGIALSRGKLLHSRLTCGQRLPDGEGAPRPVSLASFWNKSERPSQLLSSL